MMKRLFIIPLALVSMSGASANVATTLNSANDTVQRAILRDVCEGDDMMAAMPRDGRATLAPLDAATYDAIERDLMHAYRQTN